MVPDSRASHACRPTLALAVGTFPSIAPGKLQLGRDADRGVENWRRKG